MKMKFYTWKDIDRYFLLNHTLWKDKIDSIDVYPTDITIYAKDNSKDKIWEVIQTLFGSNYDPAKKEIKLDIGAYTLPIYVQYDDTMSCKRKILPLFAK